MEFGKVSPQQLANICFDLPAVPQDTIQCLQIRATGKLPIVYVGCPVWANKEWIGSWYPNGAQDKDFLYHYARLFNVIELNSTHYNIPHSTVVENWRKKVPANFRFCPKFPQEISHVLLPQGKAKDLTQVFCQTMQGLEENLGTSFLQLPPTFTPEHMDFLWKFCDDLPTDYKLAIEFRQAEWFVGEVLPATVAKLATYSIGTVITDTAGRRDAVHLALSNDTLMLRFVGNNLHKSDYSRIDAWVGKLQTLIQQGIQTIYFFAHEPDNTFAPDLACYFIQQLAEHCNIILPAPQRIIQKQVGLF